MCKKYTRSVLKRLLINTKNVVCDTFLSSIKKCLPSNSDYKYNNPSKQYHPILRLGSFASFCLVLCSIYITNTNVSKLIDKCKSSLINCKFINTLIGWFNKYFRNFDDFAVSFQENFDDFAVSFQENFDPALATFAGIILSGIILLLNGEKRNIYLQLLIFRRNSPVATFILVTSFLASYFLMCVAKTNELHRATTLSAFSILICIFVIVWYLVRYNNQKKYYFEEKCRAIFKCYKNNKKFTSFLLHVFPISPEKQNNITDDVDLLKLVIQNGILDKAYYNENKKLFDSFKKYKKKHIKKEINKKNYKYEKKALKALERQLCRNGHSTTFNLPNYECIKVADVDFAVLNYFKNIIIPITVFILRTYRNTYEETIIAFQNQLGFDFHTNTVVNKYFRYLLMVISAHYLIENNRKNQKPNSVSENYTLISKWLYDNMNEYENLYGKISRNIPPSSYTDNSSNFLCYVNQSPAEDWEFLVFEYYMDMLIKEKMIQINSYHQIEIEFMKNNAILSMNQQEANHLTYTKTKLQYNSLNAVYTASRLYYKLKSN